MNFAGLAAQCHGQSFILDLLFSTIQVAQASRCQDDSSLFPRLEKTQGTHPEWNKEGKAPPEIYAGRNKRQGDPAAQSHGHEPHNKPFALLFWADIHYSDGALSTDRIWLRGIHCFDELF